MKYVQMQNRPVVLFTGTRRDLTLKERWLIELDFTQYVLPGSIVIHGQCRTGVDDYVDTLCVKAPVLFSRCPAPWQGMNGDRAAGMLRNEYMAYQLGLYLTAGHSCYVLGYPSKEGTGTQNMLTLAGKFQGLRGLFMREFD